MKGGGLLILADESHAFSVFLFCLLPFYFCLTPVELLEFFAYRPDDRVNGVVKICVAESGDEGFAPAPS